MMLPPPWRRMGGIIVCDHRSGSRRLTAMARSPLILRLDLDQKSAKGKNCRFSRGEQGSGGVVHSAFAGRTPAVMWAQETSSRSVFWGKLPLKSVTPRWLRESCEPRSCEAPGDGHRREHKWLRTSCCSI